jgi:uroporphyrinogen-III synthase
LTLDLNNKIIALTTSGRSIKEFSDRVISEGGRIIALPTIEIVPNEPKVVEQIIQIITLRDHDICAFLSANAVDILFDLAYKTSQVKKLVSLLNSRMVIAIGPNTKKRLEEHKIRVSLVPQKYSTQGLIEMFVSNINLARGKSIIIPRSSESDALVKRSLLKLGMIAVDEVMLYNVKTLKAIDNNIWGKFVSVLTMRKLDCIIFTSSSSVRAFFEIIKTDYDLPNIEDELSRVKTIIAIGPRTWQELKGRGIRASIAEIHTIIGAFELAKKNLTA